jgi:hypothetical protein
LISQESPQQDGVHISQVLDNKEKVIEFRMKSAPGHQLQLLGECDHNSLMKSH